MLTDDTVTRLMCENLAPDTRKATKGYDIEALCRAIEAAVLAEIAEMRNSLQYVTGYVSERDDWEGKEALLEYLNRFEEQQCP